MNTSKIWYVTGASQWFGLTLVKKLLDKGYRDAATSRKAQTLSQEVGLIDGERFPAMTVDLNNRASKKLATLSEELERWKSTTIGADFKQ